MTTTEHPVTVRASDLRVGDVVRFRSSFGERVARVHEPPRDEPLGVLAVLAYELGFGGYDPEPTTLRFSARQRVTVLNRPWLTP